jgi:hypothetical protein
MSDLFEAVRSRDAVIVDKLITKKADVNETRTVSCAARVASGAA